MGTNYNPNGMVLHEGYSQLDGSPIVVIATGLDGRSRNRKTGNMVQTWIMLQDVPPTEAAREGLDAAVCGDCPHRGKDGKGRSCYVTLHQAPLAVWKAYKAGRYRTADPMLAVDVVLAGAGRMVRVGSYGDPAAVPASLWRALISQATGWTGYTHQWRQPWAGEYADFLMASCDTLSDYHEARPAWRTFRVMPHGAAMLDTEVMCPANTGKTCAACRRCAGNAAKRPCVAIEVHGSAGTVNSFARNTAA